MSEDSDLDFFDLFLAKPIPCAFAWCGNQDSRSLYVGCQAGHKFDWACFQGYLKVELEKKSLQLKCPLDSCDSAISNCDLLPLLTPEQTKLISKINIRHALGKDAVECSHCSMIFFYSQEEGCAPLEKGHILTCPNCEYHFCATCSHSYTMSDCLDSCRYCHGEMSELREKISTALLAAHSVPCPTCNMTWIKNLQCTHMTCTGCGTEFCYCCGKSVEQLQLEDPTIVKLFLHNDGWPTRTGSCPMYLEEYRQLYQDDAGSLRTRRFIPRKTKDKPAKVSRKERATDIACPSDPTLALEWFHIQRGITALNLVRQQMGEVKWLQVNTLWPELLGNLDWKHLLN